MAYRGEAAVVVFRASSSVPFPCRTNVRQLDRAMCEEGGEVEESKCASATASGETLRQAGLGAFQQRLQDFVHAAAAAARVPSGAPGSCPS